MRYKLSEKFRIRQHPFLPLTAPTHTLNDNKARYQYRSCDIVNYNSQRVSHSVINFYFQEMRILVSLVILGLLCLANNPVLADGEDVDQAKAEQAKVDQAKLEKEKQTAVTNSICSSCNCDIEKGALDCSDRNLALNFKASDFEALSASMPLTNVFFKYNQIKNITVYPNVTIVTLDLSNNQIGLIENGAFAELPLLAELDLSFNRLQSDMLTPQVFQGRYDATEYQPLKKLRVLNLSGNDLHKLDADVFEHMPALEELNLSENPFMAIDPGTEIAISQIPKLKRLNLANTQLRKLPDHIFHAPRGLIEINLEGNLFDRIPDALIFAINVDTLILDENPIMRIGSKSSKFPVLTKLQRLSISNMNSLERIENHALSNLENLVELNCTDNPRLTFIHSGALSRPGREEPADTEWPDLKRVST